MRLITEKEFMTIDMNIESILKLDDLSKEDYFKEYSLYMDYLINYLINKTDIKKYDDVLNNDSHNFIAINYKSMDIYQRLAADYLKYFYIRNNLYLERLNEEERKFLKNKIYYKEYSFDNDTLNFIEKTYKKVICETEDEKVLVNYGLVSKGTLSFSDSLVIGIRYDEFNLNGKDDLEWDKNYQEQIKILNDCINKLEKNINNSLNITCKVIKYNEFTVKFID